MSVNERIIDLIDPAYLDRIPSFVRRHALERTCQLAAGRYPELYACFLGESEPEEDERQRMKTVVNEIVAVRLEKHHL